MLQESAYYHQLEILELFCSWSFPQCRSISQYYSSGEPEQEANHEPSHLQCIPSLGLLLYLFSTFHFLIIAIKIHESMTLTKSFLSLISCPLVLSVYKLTTSLKSLHEALIILALPKKSLGFICIFTLFQA